MKFLAGKPYLSPEERDRRKKERTRIQNEKRRKLFPEQHKLSERERYAKRKLLQPEWYLWKNSKTRARKSGIEHTIKVSGILIPSYCPILLIPLICGEGKVIPNSPTIDRIDNTKGYIPGNIRVISHRANSNKGSMSIEDIERLLKYIKGEI